jgi:hypothetical protein
MHLQPINLILLLLNEAAVVACMWWVSRFIAILAFMPDALNKFNNYLSYLKFSMLRRGLGIFLFTTASRTSLGPTEPPIKWVPGALSLGVKRHGREADHSPTSSAEVKEWVELYLHSPNTPSWSGAYLKHRDNFTFTLPFTFTPKISRLEPLSLLVWILLMLEMTGKRNVSCHLSTVKANYSWHFINANYTFVITEIYQQTI